MQAWSGDKIFLVWKVFIHEYFSIMIHIRIHQLLLLRCTLAPYSWGTLMIAFGCVCRYSSGEEKHRLWSRGGFHRSMRGSSKFCAERIHHPSADETRAACMNCYFTCPTASSRAPTKSFAALWNTVMLRLNIFAGSSFDGWLSEMDMYRVLFFASLIST